MLIHSLLILIRIDITSYCILNKLVKRVCNRKRDTINRIKRWIEVAPFANKHVF